MKKIITILSVIIIIAITAVVYGFSNFDNTTDNVVSTDKTKVVILVDESCISNNVKAKLIIENRNGFDINMFGVYCQNENIYFDIESKNVFTIENGDTFNYDFTITFNEKTNNEDYLSLLENERVLVSFNADAANQNSDITYVISEIQADNTGDYPLC